MNMIELISVTSLVENVVAMFDGKEDRGTGVIHDFGKDYKKIFRQNSN